MALHPDAEPGAEPVDRPLQSGIVEGHQPAAALAHEMMVMVTSGLRSLEPRLPVSHLDTLDQPMLDEEVQGAIDRGSPGGPSLGAQRVLDFDRAQRAWLRRQQLDHAVAGAPALQPGAPQDGVNVLVPVH